MGLLQLPGEGVSLPDPAAGHAGGKTTALCIQLLAALRESLRLPGPGVQSRETEVAGEDGRQRA